MLKITHIKDGDSSSNNVVVNTSRHISELDVKFNHKRVISIYLLAQAAASYKPALAQDLGNYRNTLSLTVRRDVDLAATPAAFPDAEGALSFALQQPALFTTTGVLKIELVGATTNVTLYMLNTAVEVIEMPDPLGVAPTFVYTFNGGVITATSPF